MLSAINKNRSKGYDIQTIPSELLLLYHITCNAQEILENQYNSEYKVQGTVVQSIGTTYAKNI